MATSPAKYKACCLNEGLDSRPLRPFFNLLLLSIAPTSMTPSSATFPTTWLRCPQRDTFSSCRKSEEASRTARNPAAATRSVSLNRRDTLEEAVSKVNPRPSANQARDRRNTLRVRTFRKRE